MFKNRGKLLSFIVLICIIPILLLFVIFNFIKYEQDVNIKNMNIAIVNEDKPAKFKGKTVNVGKEVQKTLSKDKQVKWHFVDAQDAKKNLDNGKYAMKIVLPKNFSKNATTALDKNPKVSTLKVQTSDKNNYLAGMITTQVVEQMKGKVVKSIQRAYDDSALKALGQLGDGVTQASDGVSQLNDASTQLNDGSKQISDNLHVLKNGTQQLADGAAPLQSGVNQLSSGSSLLASNSSTLVAGANQLNGGISQLTAGSGLLSQKLADASAQIDAQLNGSQDDLTNLYAGLTALNDGIQQMNAQVSDPANDNSAAITADLNQVGTNLTNAGNLLQDTGAKLQDLNTNVYDTTNPQSVASQLTAMQELMANDPDFKEFLKTHMSFGLKLNSYSVAVKQQLTNTGNNDLAPVKTNLAQMGTELQSAGGLLQGDVTTQLTKTQDNMNKLKAGINQMAAPDQAPLALNGAKQAINTLTGGLAQVNNGLKQRGTTTSTMGGIQATQQIHNGLVQVQAGLKGTNGQLGLIPGLITYTGGVDQLNGGLTTLSGSAPTLINGITQLNDGAGKLATGADQLTSGLRQAGDGIGLLNIKLSDGSKQVKGLSTGTANVNHFVSPVEDEVLNAKESHDLINAFAPLVLTLVFFVGAMLTQMSLFRNNNNEEASLKQKVLSVSSVVLAQTILIDAFSMILGLQVQQPVSFLVISLLTSAAFTLTCLALDKLFGTIGLLVALALLFLQLIITGGLFPNEMLSSFYQVLAIFLPGTYSISGFEQAVNGNGAALITSSLILVLFGLVFFAALFGNEIKNKFFAKENVQAK
ncbi:YhgE/Pip domain-containing protein [Lactobacillus sp. YT155]|uniref:YhgE/Pip family protein n=1 Tax=Lactobacillus sp. YT155 TaxID=3060955 RepID=UPI00265E7ECA|nr:YhgE/Pip domain-containing protein [Lactobacillus sp. YT155]MDO1604846.1 YhgE/Pip domain-containing protein [Lactobacillus sp. YT155]